VVLKVGSCWGVDPTLFNTTPLQNFQQKQTVSVLCRLLLQGTMQKNTLLVIISFFQTPNFWRIPRHSSVPGFEIADSLAMLATSSMILHPDDNDHRKTVQSSPHYADMYFPICDHHFILFTEKYVNVTKCFACKHFYLKSRRTIKHENMAPSQCFHPGWSL